MPWGNSRRGKELLAGIFLLALTLINVGRVFELAPFLRSGYQDFTAFYGGAEMVRGGQTARLYDLTPQYRLQSQFAPNVAIRRAALPYNHPPFEALLFVPLTYLWYWPAYLLWTLLNVAMLAVSLRILRKTFPEVAGLSLSFVALAATGFVPVVMTCIHGQDSVLLLLLFTISLSSLEKGDDIVAGAALGAGLFKFHFAVPMALILAMRRPRLLMGFSPVAAILAAVSLGMVGWSGLSDYAHLIFQMEKNGAGGAVIAAMPNLRGLLMGLPEVESGGKTAILLTIVCSIAALAIALRMITRRDVSIRYAFAVASVTSVMVSYHALTHDLAWLLPVVLLLFSAGAETAGKKMQADVILLVLIYTIFFAAWLWPWVNPWWCVPFAIWIGWKLRPGHAAEAVT